MLLFILGMFTMPSIGYACVKKTVATEKACCKEKAADKKQSKSCCDSDSSEDDSCEGKCGNSNCTTSTSSGFSLFVYNEIELSTNNFNFSTRKIKFHYAENLLSDGFTSIWLIPKIS